MKKLLFICFIISLFSCSSDTKKENIDEKAPPVIAPQDSTMSV